jgi:predicted dehydrogenase
MTIHRIDYAQDLMGNMTAICGAVAQFAPRDRQPDGTPCPPSEVDDWSALICQFERGGTGVLEGTTLAKGYHFDGFGHDWAEVNGSEATAVYQLKEPNTILVGKHGESLRQIEVPVQFLVPEGSPRDPKQGVPSTVFRYDLVWEFVSAIVEGRDAVPGFDHGARAQAVADAVLESFERRTWVNIAPALD